MALSDFIVNTDYPLEQMVFLYSGSVASPAMGGGTITIPHGLPFAPMPHMVWSTTPDFAITNETIDEQMGDGLITFMGVGREYVAYADATNIIIEWYTNSTAATVYYRIFCYPPSTVSLSSEVAFTANQADSFVLNTDYNYLKLAYTGVLTSASPSFAHNIGYIPRFQCWEYIPFMGWSKKISSTIMANMTFGSAVTMSSTTIAREGGAASYGDIEYRIYLDE